MERPRKGPAILLTVSSFLALACHANGELALVPQQPPNISTIQFDGAGRLAVAGSGNSTQVWDVENGSLMMNLPSHVGAPVREVDFLSQKLVHSFGNDGVSVVWDWMEPGVESRVQLGSDVIAVCVRMENQTRIVARSSGIFSYPIGDQPPLSLVPFDEPVWNAVFDERCRRTLLQFAHGGVSLVDIDAQARTELGIFPPRSHLLLSPSATYGLMVDSEGRAVRWDLQTGQAINIITEGGSVHDYLDEVYDDFEWFDNEPSTFCYATTFNGRRLDGDANTCEEETPSTSDHVESDAPGVWVEIFGVDDLGGISFRAQFPESSGQFGHTTMGSVGRPDDGNMGLDIAGHLWREWFGRFNSSNGKSFLDPIGSDDLGTALGQWAPENGRVDLHWVERRNSMPDSVEYAYTDPYFIVADAAGASVWDGIGTSSRRLSWHALAFPSFFGIRNDVYVATHQADVGPDAFWIWDLATERFLHDNDILLVSTDEDGLIYHGEGLHYLSFADLESTKLSGPCEYPDAATVKGTVVALWCKVPFPIAQQYQAVPDLIGTVTVFDMASGRLVSNFDVRRSKTGDGCDESVLCASEIHIWEDGTDILLLHGASLVLSRIDDGYVVEEFRLELPRTDGFWSVVGRYGNKILLNSMGRQAFVSFDGRIDLLEELHKGDRYSVIHGHTSLIFGSIETGYDVVEVDGRRRGNPS